MAFWRRKNRSMKRYGGRKTEVWPRRGEQSSLVNSEGVFGLEWEWKLDTSVCIRPWRTLNTCLRTSFIKPWGAFESLSRVEASKHRLSPMEINTMPYSSILSRGVLISVCLRYCDGFYCIQIFTIWSSKPGETRPLRHLPLTKLPEDRGTISARGTCHT